MKLFTIVGLLLCCYQAQAKAVFAHFMVGNVPSWDVPRWTQDINLAIEAHIDAFALNIAYNDTTVAASVSKAFQAASGTQFKLFFSFDYAGGGAWPKADVQQYLDSYLQHGSYYHTDAGQPFVSTFEGPDNYADWQEFRTTYGCFFIPDWSSRGAAGAWALNAADGLFSWAAWPWADEDSNTYVDASYRQALGGHPYMMPVSPWFYTNLPGFDKNWLWRGDDLWYDRWQEIIYVQPEYVEILTWNDFGESHYIGPRDHTQYDLFDASHGKAAYNYAANFPHDGWRLFLPFVIDLYKTGRAAIDQEGLVVWYRVTPAVTGCSPNETSGNTASQLQIELEPSEVVQDKIFFSALLAQGAEPWVEVGGNDLDAMWSHVPYGGAGLYHGSASLNGHTGNVIVSVFRDQEVLTLNGTPINTTCQDNIQNWNAWVGFDRGGTVSDTIASIEGYVCTDGTSVADFALLCNYTCSLGYCPLGACNCLEIGPQPDIPKSTGVQGYPAADQSVNYAGLCNFACNLGYCPPSFCGTVDVPVPTPTVSPFNPPACTGGYGSGHFADLCEWACGYGYCPVAACSCSETGVLNNPPPAVSGVRATFLPISGDMGYDDLCTWTCSRGHCPAGICGSNFGCVSGTGDGNYGGLCDFSCGRGFCPDPCTCLANGTVDSTVGLLPGYAGEANPDLDENYGPLCNFTCAHNYCPSGACSENINLDIAYPSATIADTSITGLVGFSTDDTTYYPGDSFFYETLNPDIGIEVTLSNGPTTFDAESCSGTVPPGTNGGVLGCIAEAIVWMTYTIYTAGGPVETTPLRRGLNATHHVSSPTNPSLNSTDYHFEYHPEWHPRGNCSTALCMFVSKAPSHTWTPLGNGTYNGVFHDLHVIHTGKIIGHRVWPGGYSDESSAASTLVKRGYMTDGGPIRFRNGRPIGMYTSQDSSDIWRTWYEDDAKGTLDASKVFGAAVEEAVAATSFGELCVGMLDAGTLLGEPMLFDIVGNDTAQELSLNQAENDLAGCSQTQQTQLTCIADASEIDPDLLNDEDTESALPSPDFSTKRSLTSGSSETYVIQDRGGTTGRTLAWQTPTYPNGNNGADLAAANGNTNAYALANPGNCEDGSITDSAPTTGPNAVTVVSEHVPERVTGRNFLEFVQEGFMNILTPDGTSGNDNLQFANCPSVSFDILSQWANVPYAQWNVQWTGAGAIPQGSALSQFANTFGSSTNPGVMTNLQHSLNRYKEDVFNTANRPTSDSRFNSFTSPTISNTESALTLLRQGFAIFNYINDNHVQTLLGTSYQQASSVWQQFDSLYNAATGSNIDMECMWRNFWNFLAQRIANNHRRYMNDRLDQLAAPWLNLQNRASSTQQQRDTAEEVLDVIDSFRGQIDSTIYFNRQNFV